MNENAKDGLRFIRLSQRRDKGGRIVGKSKYLPVGQYYYYSARLQGSSKQKAQEALDYCCASIIPMIKMK